MLEREEDRVEKPKPETYDCGDCRAVVDVEKHGRLWSAEHKLWLCGDCFARLVLHETPEEIAERKARYA